LVAFKAGGKYMQTEIREIIFMLPAAEYMASPRKFILGLSKDHSSKESFRHLSVLNFIQQRKV